MVVLQFGFNPHERDSVHRPERYRAGQVLYTGTHDNDTLRGWYESLPPESVELVRAEGVRGREPWWGLMELALSSKPRLCMLQAQDVLGLGSRGAHEHARGGGWAVEVAPGCRVQLTPALARRLRRITAAAGRLP